MGREAKRPRQFPCSPGTQGSPRDPRSHLHQKIQTTLMTEKIQMPASTGIGVSAGYGRADSLGSR